MSASESAGSLPTLLVVDDDPAFCRVTKRVMEARGFAVRVAHSVEQSIWMAVDDPPEYALVDLKMPDESGLTLVQRLKQIDSGTRVVVLSGYASIATATEAIKLGAAHCLAKPATTKEILAAFKRVDPPPDGVLSDDPMRVGQVEWEHMKKVLLEHQGNILATANALGMHWRTLQRELSKRPGKT